MPALALSGATQQQRIWSRITADYGSLALHVRADSSPRSLLPRPCYEVQVLVP